MDPMVTTPSRQELVASVIEIVVRLAHERGIEIDPVLLDEGTNVRDYDLDSMDQVLILNEVEDRWRVTVEDDAARSGASIGALVDAVEAALATR
jgi:adenine/guanine phosphoribosyltransferase-like PRPP-binding protein